MAQTSKQPTPLLSTGIADEIVESGKRRVGEQLTQRTKVGSDGSEHEHNSPPYGQG